MASLQEIPVWEEEIYRIQAHVDSPVGGPDGITNVQPRQIANRTLWLLSRLAREHTLTGHMLTEAQVAEGANIDEDKTILDVPFDELRDKLAECLEELIKLEDLTAETIGKDGLKFETIVRAQLFLWDHGAYSYGWEFFTDAMNMRQFVERPIISTVHHDDTIILDDVTGISRGDTLVVYSGNGADAEIIEVANIIHADFGEYRILAKDVRDPDTGEIIDYAINVDRDGGFIGSMSWSVGNDLVATAAPGSIYLSGTIDALANAQSGILVIRNTDSRGHITVEISSNGGPWTVLERYGVESYGDDGYDAMYKLPSGMLKLRVTSDGNAAAKIGYMAVIPFVGERTVAPIRKPVLIKPDNNSTLAVYEVAMESSVFRRAYHDNFVKTEFSFSHDNGIPDENTPIWTVSNGVEAHVSDIAPDGTYILHDQALKDFLDAMDGDDRVLPFGDYFMRCRHISDVGDASEWSDPVAFTLIDTARIFGFDGTDATLRIGGFDAEGIGEPSETSGIFSSLKDSSIKRFGFAGTPTKETAGLDNGTFITE